MCGTADFVPLMRGVAGLLSIRSFEVPESTFDLSRLLLLGLFEDDMLKTWSSLKPENF